MNGSPKLPRPSDAARLWLDAISRQDKLAILLHSHADIEVHGPNGVTTGREAIAEWYRSIPMRISIRRIVERGSEVLVHHHIEWLSADGTVEDTIDNAALIETQEGKVRSYRRVADPGLIGEGARHEAGW
jgi:hypothetical protein